jgi:hypothetical protein
VSTSEQRDALYVLVELLIVAGELEEALSTAC